MKMPIDAPLTIAAIVAVAMFAAGYASAGEYDHIVEIESSDFNKRWLAVSLLDTHNCAPYLELLFESKETREDKTFEGVPLKSRVDRRPIQTTHPTVVVSGKYEYIKLGFMSQTDIDEFRRGTTFRVKFEASSGTFYDSYSLMGFSKAYAKAKASCTPTNHERYFDQPEKTKNELYL